MGARPTLSVVVYGSLLDPAALRAVVEDPEGRVWPVKLRGFERRCNQTASWRETDDDRRAVLNVVRSDDAWCNGLVVTDLLRGEFEAFRERERGYRLVEVDPADLDPYPRRDIDTPFETSDPGLADQDLLLVTTGTRVATDIRPIPSYLEACLDGASRWGGTFFADFKSTTPEVR